ncbi:cytochrome c [Pseudomonas veronii]|uniref:c-type cytochrome n=1 Tax=Pseudomonas veronii TaxID=76761 RepID=UPI0021C22041|nr:cytochrome c [Pseudomonas veronii]MCT8962811.1 cytochrome c [Pseudomonas veronii]
MSHRTSLSLLALLLYTAGPEAAGFNLQAPGVDRQRFLIHLVRQDCGSCHGLTLRGGLGPALTPAALGGKSRDYVAYTILHGRPGSAMPGWSNFLNDGEAEWIAQRLLDGFPDQNEMLP